MKFEFDMSKNEANIQKHGLRFLDVGSLEWHHVYYELDDRKDYGEDRFVAYLPKEGRLYIVCFTMRDNVYRIISFRKANKREENHYAQETADR